MKTDRRSFIRKSSLIGIGSTLGPRVLFPREASIVPEGRKAGIIGLDTSHSIAFTKTLNNNPDGLDFHGYKVVAAYPHGSRDIESSAGRIPGYTEDIKKLGVTVVDSIGQLLDMVDVVLLETNDGRLHLEQALQVFKAGKRVFIDKPIAASLSDAMAIFNAAEKFNVPVFSSSSLRYMHGIKEIAEGVIGQVTGASTYSPSPIEKTHPDLFWYGIHGVEILFTLMGTGCKEVTRIYTEGTDIVTGTWQDGRAGTFRGIREGKRGYGGTVFGEKGIRTLGEYAGYSPLLEKIAGFFETGIPPVTREETLEIFAFMEAADESKARGGQSVSIDEVMNKAKSM
jgi:predicted dehydrogenase